MRMVTSACKLVETRVADAGSGAGAPALDRHWVDQVISAFGEAFNNVVLHAYRNGDGDLEIEVEDKQDRLIIRLIDYGQSFDLEAVPLPDLDQLPESGLGIYIMRACMDDVSYEKGQGGQGGRPNILSMTKYLAGAPA
jgi:serine/threonine-protein kinase RsbW